MTSSVAWRTSGCRSSCRAPCRRDRGASCIRWGEPAFDPLTQLPSGVQLSFFASAFAFGTPDVPLSRIPFQQFADDAARGVLRSRPAHVFEFADIVAAHRLMESGEARGKIVVCGPEA